jgi:spore coat protein U-like protein
MQFNKQLLAATLLTAGGFAAISSANAAEGPATDEFNVTMTVAPSCSVVAGSEISLGSIDAGTDAPAALGSTFKVACSMGTPYTISMLPSGVSSAGLGVMKSATADDVNGNTDTIAYKLTSDANGEVVWANTIGADGTGTETDEPYTVYAKVTETDFATIKPDTYSESVTISVAY